MSLAKSNDPAALWNGYLKSGAPHPEALPYATTWQMRRVRLYNLNLMTPSKWHKELKLALAAEEANDYRFVR